MKTLALILFSVVFQISSIVFAGHAVPAKKTFVLLGVSGFMTGRPQNDLADIRSTDLCQDCLRSGVWTTLSGFQHPKISQHVYLEYDSGQDQVATRYQELCGSAPELVIMIDGVQQPLIFPYSQAIVAKTCANIYQSVAVVHGGPLSNCANKDISSMLTTNANIAQSHIQAEWTGSSMGAILIQKFLQIQKYASEIHDVSEGLSNRALTAPSQSRYLIWATQGCREVVLRIHS